MSSVTTRGYRRLDPAYQRGVRYQNALSGWLTSPDPSGYGDPTDPQTLNRYAYAGNDPINNTDHTGFAPTPTAPRPSVRFDPATGSGSLSVDLGFSR